MNLAIEEGTIEVFVLGRRGRYSLTPHLQRAYLALVDYMDREGRAPAVTEWAAMSGTTPERIINARGELEVRGWIAVTRTKSGYAQSRGVVLVAPVLRHLKPVENAA